MKLVLFLIIVNVLAEITSGQTTIKRNHVLSRKKRFLTFPEGSNFVVGVFYETHKRIFWGMYVLQITLSSLKEILLKVPKGYRTVVECDNTFKLPSASNRSYLKKLAMHTRHRRELYDGISNAVSVFGLNGDACMKKMICEAQYLAPFRGNSLFRQLLLAVFMSPSLSIEAEYCSKEVYKECDLSLLGMILNHIYT